MASVFKRNKTYYFKFRNASGKWCMRSARTRDKRAAERIAAKAESDALLRREFVIDSATERYSLAAGLPIQEHVDEFLKVIEARQNTPKHVRTTRRHLEYLFENASVSSVSELSNSTITRAIGDLRTQGKSLRTCNSYLSSVKSFSKWLWEEKRVSDDSLASIKSFNEETDKRHLRREMSEDEIAFLLGFVEGYTTSRHNLSGTDRAMVYRLAMATGFRAEELRSLTLESFELDSESPTVSVEAAYSKRRRRDVQPLHPQMANLLRTWLRAKQDGEAVFAKLPLDTARMIRKDLNAARGQWINDAEDEDDQNSRIKSDFLAYEDSNGRFADFHATRHTFISRIVNQGTSIKVAQELARHSTSRLTLDRYTHVRSDDVLQAISVLPNHVSTAPDDGATEPPEKSLAPYMHQVLRRTAHSECETVRTDAPQSTAIDAEDTPQNTVKTRENAAPRDEEQEEAPVGVEPTMADLQSAALATWPRRPIVRRLGN